VSQPPQTPVAFPERQVRFIRHSPSGRRPRREPGHARSSPDLAAFDVQDKALHPCRDSCRTSLPAHPTQAPPSGFGGRREDLVTKTLKKERPGL